MKYDNPQLRSVLAGEYVLGTLRGSARRRFEAVMSGDANVAAEVRRWESHLIGLADGIAPVTPPARVWRRIQSNIMPPDRTQNVRLRFWRGLGVAASVAAIALALLLAAPPFRPPAPTQDYVSVVRDDQARPVWVVTFKPGQNRMVFEALTEVPLAADESLELWLLLEGGAAPVSLGLLPASGITSKQLRPVDLLGRALGVAVSREPRGGSPTGAPTGPIVYQADLLKLG